MRKFPKQAMTSAGLLLAFLLWTAALRFVDVQAIGPQNSTVGLAEINGLIHRLTGVHFALYTVTDWLGLVPIAVCLGFAVLGMVQWIRRGSLRKVDFSLFALGGFYIAVMAAYVLFETIVINRRPVLIDGILEASYPSSTTMLALCVMPTAAMQLNERIRSRMLRRCTASAIALFTAFMVIGRLVSGVHWFSDIVGGALLSAGLVMMYRALRSLERK